MNYKDFWKKIWKEHKLLLVMDIFMIVMIAIYFHFLPSLLLQSWLLR